MHLPDTSPEDVDHVSLRHSIVCFDLALQSNFTLDFTMFDPEDIIAKLRPTDNRDPEEIVEYCQFYLHTLLPNVKRAIYVELDMIMQQDVALLWERLIESHKGHFLAAVPPDESTKADYEHSFIDIAVVKKHFQNYCQFNAVAALIIF